MNRENKCIILNRMFTGRYLEDISNIGHEIINLFRDDNQEHYIYLCDDGSYKRPDLPKYTIQVRRHSTRTLEIINIAEIECRVAKTDIFNIRYGGDKNSSNGVSIDRIFQENKGFGSNGEQKVETYVTFKAKQDRVIKPNPKHPVYIAYEGNRHKNSKSPENEGTSCTSKVNNAYVTSDEFLLNERENDKYKFDVNEKLRNYIEYVDIDAYPQSDYAKLSKIIKDAFDAVDKNDGTWLIVEDKVELDTTEGGVKDVITPAEIYGIGNLELPFSNAFSFFLLRYPKLLSGFCHYLKEIEGMDSKALADLCSYLSNHPDYKINVLREWKNIDILIEIDDKWVIVVENKIFSDLNGRDRDDKTQLDKYQKLICNSKLIEGKESNIYYNRKKIFVLFAPNHNNINIEPSSQWRKLFYKPLAEYLKGLLENDAYKDDLHLRDFTIMVERHSVDDYNLGEMTRRFKRILKELR